MCHWSRPSLHSSILFLLCWGTLSFGGVYPWAYWPLLTGCAAVGILGLVAVGQTADRWLVVAFLAIAAVIALQLIPMPPVVRHYLSPASAAFLLDRDILQMTSGGPSAMARVYEPLSIEPRATSRGLLFVCGFGLFIVGIARALDSRSTPFMIASVIALGVAVSIAAVVQDNVSRGVIYGFWQPRDFGRGFGPFVNPNHFTGWLLMILPLSVGYLMSHVARSEIPDTFRARVLWIASRDGSRVVLIGLAVLVMVFALVLAQSRAGIAILAGTAAIFGSVIVRSATAPRLRTALGYAGLLSMAAVAWLGWDRIFTPFVAADVWSIRLSGRAEIWRDTIGLFRDFPLVGSGFNTYEAAVLMYSQPRNFRALEAHNDYLQLLAEGGLLLGAAALLCAVVLTRTVREHFRTRTGDRSAYWLRAGAVVGIVAIAIQETVDFSLQMPGNFALFCFLWAVAMCDLRRESARASYEPALPRWASFYLMVALIVSSASGVFAYQQSGPYGESVSDRRIHRIYDATEKRVTDVLYDSSGNGVFDLWIDMTDRNFVVIERDVDEDGFPESGQPYTPRILVVCHKIGGKNQKTIRVVKSAVPEHLRHWDLMGPCTGGPKK